MSHFWSISIAPGVNLAQTVLVTFAILSVLARLWLRHQERNLVRASRARAIQAQANPPQPELSEDGVPYWHALVISSLSLSLRGEFEDSPRFNTKDARMSASTSRTELQGSVSSSSRTGLQGPVPK